MKKIFIFLTLSFSYILSQAQFAQSDSWKISWNKEIILETGKSSEEINTRKIKQAKLDKKYTLEIVYTETDAQKEKEWIRSFMIFDDTDKELLRKDSTRDWNITAAELKKLFGDKKKLKIYTISIPADPDLAARVRVRRVHLCTLELQ